MASSRSSSGSSSSSSSGLVWVVGAATTTGILVGVTVTSILWNRFQSSRKEKTKTSQVFFADHGKDDDDDGEQQLTRDCSRRSNHNQPRRRQAQSEGPTSFPWELRQEQISRHTLFFGKDSMHRLRQARICVVGAGGVGSHTVCSLIRSGVGYIRVIDFDQVSLSSLNRHACATLANVGTPKTTCLVEYGRALCPDPSYLVVEGHCEMYTAETSHRLLSLNMDTTTTNQDGQPQPQWDWIVDAIDDVPTKAHLIYTAWKLGVRVVSCMGAGGKADFTRLHVSDLQSASRDPLASKLRQCLKKIIKDNKSKTATATQGPNSEGEKEEATTTAMPKDCMKKDNDDAEELLMNADRLAIVFSSEKLVQKLADLTDEQMQSKHGTSSNSSAGNGDGGEKSRTSIADEYGAVPGMRIRVLPVLGTLPAIMGQSLAAWVLTEMAQQPFRPVTGERVGRNVRHKLFQKLQTREDRYLQRLLQEHNITDPTIVERYKKVGGLLTRGRTSDNGGGSNSEPAAASMKQQDAAASNDIETTTTGTIREEVWIGPLQIDIDDVEYLLEVWRNRCAVTGMRLGTVLELVRWDERRPSTCDNLILLAQPAKEKWDNKDSYYA